MRCLHEFGFDLVVNEVFLSVSGQTAEELGGNSDRKRLAMPWYPRCRRILSICILTSGGDTAQKPPRGPRDLE